MELLSELPLLESDPNSDDSSSTRRNICYGGCSRPTSICICPYLPEKPIKTSFPVFIIHHPHALSASKPNTLSSLPPLTLSLQNVHLISARKLTLQNCHPLLDVSRPSLFLFPNLPKKGLVARDVREYARRSLPLIVFDGTWSQAEEMVRASLPFLDGFATQVTIGEEEVAEGMEMRKEPRKGCVSTMEAVGKAVRVLESNEEVSLEVERVLEVVLRGIVAMQRKFLEGKNMKQRVKLMKKKDMKKMSIDENKG